MTDWLEEMRETLQRLLRFVRAVRVSIGLGVAANATIFSMVSKFALSLEPVGAPDTLVALHTTARGECCNHFSWPLFSDVREQAESFSGIAAYHDLLPALIRRQR